MQEAAFAHLSRAVACARRRHLDGLPTHELVALVYE